MLAYKVKHERFTEIDINKLTKDYNISITSIIEILRIILPIMKKNNNGKYYLRYKLLIWYSSKVSY